MKGPFAMKSHSIISMRSLCLSLCGLVFATGAVVYRAQADEWNKRTILTVDQPIQVRDRLLQPGKYVFKLLDSSSERHIVQIFNGDQSRIIDTVMAIPKQRMDPTGKTVFTFWETPPGNAKALRDWFYPGDLIGQEFPYPKHPVVLQASVTKTETETMTTPIPEPTPPPVVEPPKTETETETTTTETQVETQPETQQPVETAQATPPPTPPPANPAPAPAEQPSSLPKTGSPYPLVGLGGLASLCLYGLLRMKRVSVN
jgi:hypothetical protein